MFPSPIQKLIDLFSKFPTVGQRTASRFVFYLIKTPQEEIDDILKSIENLKKMIKICSFCFSPFDGSNDSNQENLCPICRDKIRDTSLLCVVEKEIDLLSIEKTKKHKGLYFILGKTISALRKESIKELKTEELKERIKNPEKFGISGPGFEEIIIALNPTTEGEAASLYIEREIKSLQMPNNKPVPKITKLGRGLPVGGELEYADEQTLESAFEGRK